MKAKAKQYDSFNEYLASLTNKKLKDEVVIEDEFKFKILNLTVDQMKHEEFLIDEQIQQHKDNFSQQEIINKEKYAKLSIAHSELLNPINGQLHHLQNNHKLLNLNYQTLKESLGTIQYQSINQQIQAFQEQNNNIEKIQVYLTIPSILNQCLQSNLYVKAIQIIRHYEKNFSSQIFSEENQESNELTKQVDKEVQLLKQKLIKAIYIQLETSFKNKPSNASHSSQNKKVKQTRDYITMLKALQESSDTINESLLKSRARYLRQFTQKTTIEFYKSLQFTKKSQNYQEGELLIKHVLSPFLGHIKDIYLEFEELKVQNTTEWLILRQSESRNLIKVIIKKAKVRDIIELTGLVNKFNREVSSWVKLVIDDILKREMEGRIVNEVQKAFANSSQLFLDSFKRFQDKSQFQPDGLIDLLRINLKTLEQQYNQISCINKKDLKRIFQVTVQKVFEKTVPQILMNYYEKHFQDQNIVVSSMKEIVKKLCELQVFYFFLNFYLIMQSQQQPQKKPSTLSAFFGCCMKPVKKQEPPSKSSGKKGNQKEENLNILSQKQNKSDQDKKHQLPNKNINQKLSEENRKPKNINEDKEQSKSSLERSLRDVELILSQRGGGAGADQTKDGKMEHNLQEGLLIQIQNSLNRDLNSNSLVLYNQGSVSNDKSVSSKSPAKIHLRNASINQNNSRREQQLILVNMNEKSTSKASPTFKAQTHNNSEFVNQSFLAKNQQQANIPSLKQSFAYEQQNEANLSKLTKQQSSNKHLNANNQEDAGGADEEEENVELAERPLQLASNKIHVSKTPIQLTEGMNQKNLPSNSSGKNSPQAGTPLIPSQSNSNRKGPNPSQKDYVSYSYHSIKFQSNLDEYRSSQGMSNPPRPNFFRIDSSEHHTDNLQLPEANIKMTSQSHSIASSQTSSNKFKMIGDYGHISPITGQQNTESKIMNSYSEDNDIHRQFSSNPNSQHSLNLGIPSNYHRNQNFIQSQHQKRSTFDYNEIMHELKKHSGASQVIQVNAVQIPEQQYLEKSFTFQNVNINPPNKLAHHTSVNHTSTIATTPRKDQVSQAFNFIPKSLFEAYHIEKEAQLNKAYKKITQLSSQLEQMKQKHKDSQNEVKELKKENLEIRNNMNFLLQLNLRGE